MSSPRSVTVDRRDDIDSKNIVWTRLLETVQSRYALACHCCRCSGDSCHTNRNYLCMLTFRPDRVVPVFTHSVILRLLEGYIPASGPVHDGNSATWSATMRLVSLKSAHTPGLVAWFRPGLRCFTSTFIDFTGFPRTQVTITFSFFFNLHNF